MKHLLFIAIILLSLFSCKKEVTIDKTDSVLIDRIKAQLKDSLNSIDYDALNFNEGIFINLEAKNKSFFRLPFRNKSIESDFVLLELKNDTAFSLGKIIHLQQNAVTATTDTSFLFNGAISISTLNRRMVLNSTISNGIIDAFYAMEQPITGRPEVTSMPLLPEVILVASYPPSGGAGFAISTWFNLLDIMYGAPGAYNGTYPGGYYVTSGAGGGGGNSGGSGSSYNTQTPNYVDFEPVIITDAIDITKYINCFNAINDRGATCKIEIFTDIPVDGNPNAFFDSRNGSPGHTFLKITKSNGNQSVQQYFGFYPKSGWKIPLTTAAQDGKFIDNSGHEFNASLSMNLTVAQLQTTLIRIQYLAGFIRYDLENYNCTTFALEVFNHTRGGNQLTIPMYDLPGGTSPVGSATPEGLYQKLKAMKEAHGPEAVNITIPGVKGFAGPSKGPCN